MTLMLHPGPIPLRLDESGAVRVGASRVTLDILVQRFNQGHSPESLAQSFATLQLADIYSVIGYYLRHRAEVDAYLSQREREADALRAERPEFFVDGSAVRERLQARLASGPAGDAPVSHG
jgi:uncharacterized protein (DUF433 family)